MSGNQLPPGDQNQAALPPSAAASTALAPAMDIDYSMLQPPVAEGAGIPWRRYVAALRRYKWLILLVIIATVIVSEWVSAKVRHAII